MTLSTNGTREVFISSRIRLGIAALLLLLLLASAPALFGRAPASGDTTQVLVLGTYHFANPGLDVAKTEVADVLSIERQAEIQAVVDALARFRPTKIVVEHEPASAARLDSLYGAYVEGRHELSRDETQQLGFRLAARLGHARVYPIDYRNDFPFEAMMAYAQEHDTAFVRFVDEELARQTAAANRAQRESTVGEILRSKNAPRQLAADHGTYMRFARVGSGDTYVGAELVAKWYERNIHIFANLQRVAEPGDRVLVIFGAGHAPILRELVTYDPDMTLVDAAPYLPSD